MFEPTEEDAVAKCSCQHCGIHLEFARTAAGAEIDCPQCSQKTTLTLPEDFDPTLVVGDPHPSAVAVGDVLAAFVGSVPRTPVSLLYRTGLLLVAAMMLLL